LVEGELGTAIRDGAAHYAALEDQASRTTVRATVLHQLDQLELKKRPDDLVTQRVGPDELASDPVLIGAAVIHLDLVFRSSVSAAEVRQTAHTGILRFAWHPDLPELPIGVVLAQPTAQLVRRRSELFSGPRPVLANTPLVMPYAVAASPGRLGAGAALLRAVVADCAELPSGPRIVTFSPLTGIRARVIRLVDDPPVWRDALAAHPGIDGNRLRDQLLELLGHYVAPPEVPEPARSWLAAEFRSFAASPDYAVGNFHRAMGAELVGLSECADPGDSDALWARAYFDYGIPQT
jgi:hypothetical protein